MNGKFAIRVIILSSLYAILYFAYHHYSHGGAFSIPGINWLALGYIFCFTNLAGLAGSRILLGLKKGLDNRVNPGFHFLTIAAASMGWIILMTVLGGLAYKTIFLQGISLGELRETFPGLVAQLLVIGIFTAILFTVFDHSLGSYYRLQKSQLAARKMMTQQLNLRFETLRNQISPHFLFNSLNTISSLIYRDVALAEKFIRNLAGVYHSVLENYELPVIPLQRELDLVERYSYLMQVRFEYAFSLEIRTPDNPERYCLPPLSIQMLVENAIKHNRLSQETPLRVQVFADGNSLVVKNNYIGNPGHVVIGKDLYQKPDRGTPQGVGLQNIQRRYELLSPQPVTITKDQDFTVKLPLIPANEGNLL